MAGTAQATPATAADRFIAELTHEAGATRRALERVPEDKLSWKPHQKSMSLGELAYHIAAMPGALAEIGGNRTWESQPVPRPEATSVREILSTLDESFSTLKRKLAEWGDDGLDAEWQLVRDDRVLLALRRSQFVRSVILNHWYHHRGQLTVYLRLLDVPLPALYGDSADEKPLG